MSSLPLVSEWRLPDSRAPDFICESSVEVSVPYSPKEPLRPDETTGMMHIRRDGSIGRELRPDSVLFTGVYGFGPGNLRADKYGSSVAKEMMDAGLAIEGGSINAYNPEHGDWRKCLEAFRQKRITDGEDLALWEGDWACPDDDAMGPDSLAALMQQPGWEGYFQGWCDWRNSATMRRPLFSLFKDEVNLAFGGDPEDATHPLLSKLAPYGGIGRVVDVLRSASGCPVAPGMFGVGDEVPVGYSRWTLPRYSDFVAQYHQPNNIPAPWTGQTLRQAAETLRWAAKHRDPNRPLSLNYGLIVDYFIRDAEGKWFKQIAATDPKSIPAQLWVNLALGATILRGYALCSYDARQPSENQAVHEYQQAVKPGDPEYYALLSSASMIRDYTPLLLGSEQPLMDAGPDFLCLHRNGPRGRIWAAVNLSETAKRVPASAVPSFDWTKAELMDSAGVRVQVFEATRQVPANGVLVLSEAKQ